MVDKAFKQFSGQPEEQGSKVFVQHEVTKLVRVSVINTADMHSEGLYHIRRGGFMEGYHAAKAKCVQMLTDLEQGFNKMMREKNGWV